MQIPNQGSPSTSSLSSLSCPASSSPFFLSSTSPSSAAYSDAPIGGGAAIRPVDASLDSSPLAATVPGGNSHPPPGLECLGTNGACGAIASWDDSPIRS